jgi:hypothetical protein
MMWASSRWLGLGSRWQVILFMASPAILYAILGAVYFAAVHRIVSPARAALWGGVLGCAAAFSLALLLLWVTNHKGGPDTSHAVKSGFVFPIIAFCLGLPLVRSVAPIAGSLGQARIGHGSMGRIGGDPADASGK